MRAAIQVSRWLGKRRRAALRNAAGWRGRNGGTREGECAGLPLKRGKRCRPKQVRHRPLCNCDLPGWSPERAKGGKFRCVRSVPGAQPAAPHRHAHVFAILPAAGGEIPLRLTRTQFRQYGGGKYDEYRKDGNRALQLSWTPDFLRLLASRRPVNGSGWRPHDIYFTHLIVPSVSTSYVWLLVPMYSGRGGFLRRT